MDTPAALDQAKGLTNPAKPRQEPPQLSSSELFRDGNLVCIEHEGQHYWLRLTRGNKLILTK